MPENTAGKSIPEALIYEMVNGKPIYYAGYKDVLKGDKRPEEIMSDGNIQSFLKLHIGALLQQLLGREYLVTAGEQGLRLKKKSWRGADIAIFRTGDFVWTPGYSKKPPLIVIEIDTKADLENFGQAVDYYEEKTEDLFGFGVQKIIWILSDSQKVKVITPDQRPKSYDWFEDIPVIGEVSFNIRKLMEAYNLDENPK